MVLREAVQMMFIISMLLAFVAIGLAISAKIDMRDARRLQTDHEWRWSSIHRTDRDIAEGIWF